MYCESCGEEVANDSEYCSNCGNAIQDGVDNDNNESKEETYNDNWWIGLVIAPLAVFGGFIFGSAYGFIQGFTGSSPIVLGSIATITEAGGIAIAIFVAPIALHFDRKYVMSATDWKPSRIYYLVAIPYVTLIVSAVYLYKRKKTIGL